MRSKEVSLWPRKVAAVKEAVKVVKENKFLVHYGVKGMRWDVRKKQDELYEQQKRLAKRREEQRVEKETARQNKNSGKVKELTKQFKEENEASKAAMQETRDQIASMVNELLEMQKRGRRNQADVARQRQRTGLIMRKFGGTKIRIV